MKANHRLPASAASLLAIAAWLIVANLTKPGYVNHWERLYLQLENQPPLAAADWNVHAIANDPNDSVSGVGWTLVYTKTPCTRTDLDMWFYLHVWPEDTANLPPHRSADGYDNLDFSCALRSCRLLDEGIDKRCVATAHLPDYPIAKVSTGQYRMVDEKPQRIGLAKEFTLQANAPRAE